MSHSLQCGAGVGFFLLLFFFSFECLPMCVFIVYMYIIQQINLGQEVVPLSESLIPLL